MSEDIVIKDDFMYNYVGVIDKIMHIKKPYIEYILRKKQYPNGVYRLRNDTRLTPYKVEIVSSRKILWLQITNELAREILGTHSPPIYGSYLRDLRKYLSRHDLSYSNQPYLYIHKIKHLPYSVQTTIYEMQ
jgi:hypothetical protein